MGTIHRILFEGWVMIFQSVKVIPWGQVWKKITTWVNGSIASIAVVYSTLTEQMRNDIGPAVLTVFAVAAIANIWLGNLKQKNLPPPL